MIRAALDDLGVERPVLVGHSLGGAVALAMALDAPERTGPLALIAPLTRTQEATPAVFRGLEVRSPLMRRVIGHTLAVPLAWRTADQVLTAVFAPDPVPNDFVTRAGGALGLRPRAYVAASADLVAVQRDIGPLSARYGELAMPRGVLFGDDDALLPPERHGKAMAEHGFEVELLEGRGHMLPISAPEACTGFVRRLAAQA
jgi:pimeloyl-ACP methyl ester carboxylesterase